MNADAPPVSALLDLSGRTAIITGASGGIGAGIAWRFAEAGAQVVCHYQNNRAAAERLVQEIQSRGGQAVAIKADVSAQSDAGALVQDALSHFNSLHILVNNAGHQPVQPLIGMSAESWQAMMAINAGGPFLTTRAFAEHLQTTGSGGAVVNIASIEAHRPAPGHAHYAASKAALLAFTKAAALELGPYGIRVNAVSPGLIERKGIEQAWPEGVERWHRVAPLRRLGQAADVADAALFLASDAARWITGVDLIVDGGVSTRPGW